jgi:hypothetical protein
MESGVSLHPPGNPEKIFSAAGQLSYWKMQSAIYPPNIAW